MVRNVMEHTIHKCGGNILSIKPIGTKSQVLQKKRIKGSPKNITGSGIQQAGPAVESKPGLTWQECGLFCQANIFLLFTFD